MIPGGQHARSIGTAPSLRSRLSGSTWARQDCPRCARRCAVLTRPARSLEISYYRSAGLVLTGMLFIPTARPDSSAQGSDLLIELVGVAGAGTPAVLTRVVPTFLIVPRFDWQV